MSQPPSPPTPPGVWATPTTGQHPTGGHQQHAVLPQTGVQRGSSLPLWLAGGALLVALVALAVAVVALLVPFGAGGFGGDPSDFAGGYGEYDGTVPGAVVGQQLSGDRIAYAVVDSLLLDGAEVEPGGVQCQTVLRLDEGSAADCHGTVDGDEEWSGWIEFYGAPGEFTLYLD